jgi:hypothetical protein
MVHLSTKIVHLWSEKWSIYAPKNYPFMLRKMVHLCSENGPFMVRKWSIYCTKNGPFIARKMIHLLHEKWTIYLPEKWSIYLAKNGLGVVVYLGAKIPGESTPLCISEPKNAGDRSRCVSWSRGSWGVDVVVYLGAGDHRESRSLCISEPTILVKFVESLQNPRDYKIENTRKNIVSCFVRCPTPPHPTLSYLSGWDLEHPGEILENSRKSSRVVENSRGFWRNPLKSSRTLEDPGEML